MSVNYVACMVVHKTTFRQQPDDLLFNTTKITERVDGLTFSPIRKIYLDLKCDFFYLVDRIQEPGLYSERCV